MERFLVLNHHAENYVPDILTEFLCKKKKKNHLYHIKTMKYGDLSVVAASIKEMEKTQITDMTQRK